MIFTIHCENEDFLSMKIYRYPFKLRLAKENNFWSRIANYYTEKTKSYRKQSMKTFR